MQQQKHKQLPQTEDWQARLAERMASEEWRESDPTLGSLTQEEVACFLLEQAYRDQRAARLYITWGWMIGPLAVSLLLFFLLTLSPVLGIDKATKKMLFGSIVLLSPFLTALLQNFLPTHLKHAHSRQSRLQNLLQTVLPTCSAPSLLPTLLKAHNTTQYRSEIDKALERILTRMSGEAIFALPFELRAELATLAEQRETPLDLSIVILLALTSAWDGNVQPVLRRLSKDARSPRLREVAAECLREFSASP